MTGNRFMKFANSLALIFVVTLVAATSFAQAPGTWTRTGSLSSARFAFTAVLLKDGGVLVAGGFDASLTSVLSSAEIYDPVSRKWKLTGSMSTARAYYAASLLPDGRVLVAGGCTNTTCYAATPTAEIFDPATGVWQPTGSMSTDRRSFSADLLQNGNVLVIGGCTAGPCSSVLVSSELYDPTTGVWSLSDRVTYERSGFRATLVTSGKVLVSGGFDPNGGRTQRIAEMYDPASGTFSDMARMNVGRFDHTATLLSDGKILAAAGLFGWADFKTGRTSEIYDPVANKWTMVGNLNNVRADHAAALLPNGKVLVAGGIGYPPGKNAVVLRSAELFDPNTSTRSLTGKMTTARDDGGMVLLSNGKVLAVGGVSNGGVVVASAELYNP